MVKKSWVLLVVLLHSYYLFAQQGWVTPMDMSEHAPAAPASAGLGKYFDYPVNYSTGLPGISIPLYTIKSGSITIPITLSYHAGGVLINENATWVGMGWSLDAGGAVTKRTNGLDDFAATLPDAGTSGLTYDYFDTDDYTAAVNYGDRIMPFHSITEAVDMDPLVLDANSQEALYVRIAQGTIDGESDDYYFSTPEGGGRFYYDQKKSLFQTDRIGTWQVLFGGVAGKPSDAGINTTWDIINGSGTMKYHYGAAEIAMDGRIPQANYGFQDINTVYSGSVASSACYLSSVYDYQHDKTVSLQYNSVTTDSYAGVDQSKEYNNTGAIAGWAYFNATSQINRRLGSEVTVKEIDFDQGKVLFIQDANARQDGGVNALQEIRVLDNNGNIIKRILFTYSYTTADAGTLTPLSNNNVYGILGTGDLASFTKRLFLQSIQEINTSSNGSVVSNPPYQFTYNTDQPLPCRFSFAQDHWGYYNGKTSNQLLIPDNLLTSYSTPAAGTGGNREIDTNYTRAGSIKEIYYPTGGKTLFEFENNKQAGGGLVGGLRIRKLTQYDNINQASMIKEYSYTDANGQESGVILFNPQYLDSYIFDPDQGDGYGGRTIYRFSSSSIYPLFSAQGKPVMYTNVAEKQVSSTSSLMAKHYLTQPDLYQENSGYGVPHNKYATNDNFSGLEYQQEVYMQNADASYAVIQKDSSILQPLNNLQEYIWNVQAALEEPGEHGWLVSPGSTPVVPEQIMIPAATNTYKTYRDHAVTKEKYHMEYDGQKTLTQPMHMDYDVTNGNTLVTTTYNSEGDLLIKKTSFATNYNNGVTGYDAQIQFMLDHNMLSVPVEIVAYIQKKNTTTQLLTDAVFYEYDQYNVKKVYKFVAAAPIADFQPSAVTGSGLVHDSRYQLFQEVQNRDANNNPLTVTLRTGTESYIWDYTNDIVTAMVKNAATNDVAYNSFESDGNGNWTIPSTARDNSAVTGTHSYNLSNGSITSVNTLQSGTTYIVSYWSNNGSHLVNGGSPASTGMTANNSWTYYEHVITGATQATVSGSGDIDELRLYPKGALMVSYTYQPLVGMNTQCDANNKISYYEYDALGRLNIVRDQYQNIIKKFCYNYAGLAINCDGTPN